MKIGILTHPLDYNYGCLLQAFALQKTLRNLGHEVVTINRYSDTHQSIAMQLKSWIIRFILRILGRNVTLCWNPTLSMKMKQILSINTQQFVNRNIVNTGPVFPLDLERIDNEFQFDAYIVGSDQVWLPNFSLNCFLDFVHRDNVKKVFYAASSGSRSFADVPQLVERCRILSEKFSGISVREDSLIEVVKKTLGREAVQVLDPTLLLDAKDYVEACIENENTEPIIFTYILDKTSDKQKLIDLVKDDLKLSIIAGSVEKDFEKGKGMDIFKCIYPSVDHWLLNMARAKFVVTDSFHGTCMAITFRKPFVVVGNKTRGINRFLSLLKMFNLQDRLLLNVSDFRSSLYEPLDDSELTKKIKLMREFSINFIVDNLK